MNEDEEEGDEERKHRNFSVWQLLQKVFIIERFVLMKRSSFLAIHTLVGWF